MEHGNQPSEAFPDLSGDMPAASHAVSRRASLSVVHSRLALALPQQPAPAGWREGLEQLLGWLGIDAELVDAAPAHRLKQMAGWAMANGAGDPASVFAPWVNWSPVAFQHGGLAVLPRAQWVASYLLDHGIGLAARQRGVDCMLMSPHPAACAQDEVGSPPLPRAAVMQAMIRAAKAEGRERLAIIVHAQQRGALARLLLQADRALTRDGIAVEILGIEDALGPLMRGAASWDALIVMPDLRSIVFAMLAEMTGVRGALPMLWHGPQLKLITGEWAGDGAAQPALDAAVLIHALALRLRHAGNDRAAFRLHEAWARLRDSGVTTATRGSSAPYVTELGDAAFLDRLCQPPPATSRPLPGWRALDGTAGAKAKRDKFELRIVASNSTNPLR